MSQPQENNIQFQLRLLGRLMVFVLRIRPDAAFTTLLGIVSSMLEVASLAVLVPLTRLAAQQPILAGSTWSRIVGTIGFVPDAQFFTVAFFALLFARTVTQLVATILTHHLNRQLNGVFSIRALEAFVRHLSFSEVQKESIGHFVSVAGEEAVRAASIASTVVRLVPLLVLFALYFAMITFQSWQTGLGFLLFALFVLGCLWGAFKKSHELGHRSQQQSREAGTHFIETLSGLRTVRALIAEPYATDRYARLTRIYKHTLFLVDSINSLGGAVPTLFLTAAMLVALTLFISQTQLTAMLPGIMVGILMVLRLLPLTSQTLDAALRLTSDLKAAQDVSEMLDAVRSAEIINNRAARELDQPISRIEFDNVFYRYDPSLPVVLDAFSVNFVAGKSYAISGPSGSGKSTIVDLLLKFFSGHEGAIRVNGQDIKEIANTSLRSRIVLAEQTVRIFHDSITQNVRFGHDGLPGGVEECLKLVGLCDFLRTLPAGANTILGFQGGNVSGGQRQRIGLARALLRQADVLIMDESTSALDHVTREKILSSILQRYRDKIVIFIAHDPTILELVDEVIYLKPVDAPVPIAV